ncbi:hypothetical protein ACHAL6_04815 [Proteiniclasticum sp. C24MP]|uniref:hypothetical protein n=1 Tax=Proteiniclasticum sp. C24MP TaxID=3374101 RepID=UPI0037552263
MEHTEKTEIINSYNEDYFKARFKKKLFGGYNPAEVVDFVNAMNSNFQNSDQNLRKNIMKLTQDKQTAENELHTLKSEQNSRLLEMKQEMDALLEELDEKNGIILSHESLLSEYSMRLEEGGGKFEETIMELRTEKDALETLLVQEKEKSHELSERIYALNEEMRLLNLQVEDLENQNDTTYLDEKVEQMKLEAYAQVDEEKRISLSLRQEIKALQSRLEEVEKSNEAIRNKLYEEKNLRIAVEENLSEEKKKFSDLQISGFKKEFSSIQQFLEELSMEQEIRNRELELELQLEREKTEKAEERIENLLAKYGALKDKVLWEKKQFMTKLSELADGHSKFVSDFNLVLTEPTPIDSKEASNQ